MKGRSKWRTVLMPIRHGFHLGADGAMGTVPTTVPTTRAINRGCGGTQQDADCSVRYQYGYGHAPKGIRGAGFTLLEVMISLAILATSFSALIGAQSSSIVVNRYILDVSIASLLAKSQMIRLEHYVQDEGLDDFDTELSGDFSKDGHPKFKWKALLEKLEVEDGAVEQLTSQVPADKDAALQQLTSMPALAGMDFSSLPINPTMALQAVQYLPMLIDMLGQHMRRVTLTITWPDGKRERSLDISTYMVFMEPIPQIGGNLDEQQDGTGTANPPYSTGGNMGAGGLGGIGTRRAP